MNLIADGLLVSAALVACFYCWMLNRRLNALKRTDEGLGASIKALAGSVEQTREALKSARAEADQEQARLAKLISDARAARDEIDDIAVVRAEIAAAASETETRRDALLESIAAGLDVDERLTSALGALEKLDASNLAARDAETALGGLVAQADEADARLRGVLEARDEIVA
ncbi:MAG: hypothetical protein AAFR16_07695, partial [Pseudomonadota bacterium]